MTNDGKKRNAWRGEPPQAPVPGPVPKVSETVELEAVEADPNLDFATGPRRPALGAASSSTNAPPDASSPSSTATPATAAPPPKPPAQEEPETIQLKGRLEDSEMDMTPMVDIVFQLLIFFMVTAAFSMQKSKQLPTPKEDRPSTSAVNVDPENDGDFVIVMVDSYNSFRVQTPDFDEEAPSEQDLLIWLRRAKQGASDGKTPTKLMIKAHRDSLHEKVVTALDAGAAVGMEQIQLQTVEQDEE